MIISSTCGLEELNSSYVWIGQTKSNQIFSNWQFGANVKIRLSALKSLTKHLLTLCFVNLSRSLLVRGLINVFYNEIDPERSHSHSWLSDTKLWLELLNCEIIFCLTTSDRSQRHKALIQTLFQAIGFFFTIHRSWIESWLRY